MFEELTIVAVDRWNNSSEKNVKINVKGNKSEPKFVKITIDIQDTQVVEIIEPLDPTFPNCT